MKRVRGVGGRIRGADHAQGDEWREQVGDVEVRIVEEECGEVAEQLGYGRLTDTAPSHPALLSLAGLAGAAQLVA